MTRDRDHTSADVGRQGRHRGRATGQEQAGASSRRHVRSVGRHERLVEREDELFAIDRALGASLRGKGGVVVIEAPAGKGKTRLLAAAGDRARQLSIQVLGAQGTELEQEFPYGVAVQLFEPLWVSSDPDTRVRLSAGPALAAAELLEHGGPAPGASAETEAFSAAHGLTWLARNLTGLDGGERPRVLLMLVDDAHWADRASLRFLAYLGSRISELPIVLVMSVRTGEPSLDQRALTSLRDAPDTTVLQPPALSAYGVAEIVHAQFPGADPAFVRACLLATAGNPFLLGRLLDQVRQDRLTPDATTARALAELTPEAVLRSVLTRLDRLPSPARGLARALAVLGDGTSLELVARLAEVSAAEAGVAADLLARLGLLHPGAPLAFVHPLIRSAIRASLSPLDRGAAHGHAASLLLETGAADEQVAAQLLHAPPERELAAQRALLQRRRPGAGQRSSRERGANARARHRRGPGRHDATRARPRAHTCAGRRRPARCDPGAARSDRPQPSGSASGAPRAGARPGARG